MSEYDLTDKAVEAMTASETAAVFLTLLTIFTDGEPALYLVDDKQSLVSRGQKFTPCAFTVVLPDQSSDGGNKACQLKIDNTDIIIFKTIKKAIAQKITAELAVVMSHTPDEYERGPLRFILRNVSADKNAITGELHDFYLHDRKFTALTYSPKDFPGLFY